MCFDEFSKDRWVFPSELVRVTGDRGGEVYLILGPEKTALYDCGMPYGGGNLVRNIEKSLGNRPLDFVLLSHSHFDHVGGLPQVKERWPKAVVCGHERCRKVFASEGARRTMQKMDQKSREFMTSLTAGAFHAERLVVDRVVKEGDRIDLGKLSDSTRMSILVLETPGHTKDTLTYCIEPQKYMFASESTGVLATEDLIIPSILTGYEDSLASAKKCAAYVPTFIISPHFGAVPRGFETKYFDVYQREAAKQRALIIKLFDEGKEQATVMQAMEDMYFPASYRLDQCREAFTANAIATIGLFNPPGEEQDD